MADAAGHAIAFRIAPGQAHELPQAIPLLNRLPGVPKWVVGDCGYTSQAFREHIDAFIQRLDTKLATLLPHGGEETAA